MFSRHYKTWRVIQILSVLALKDGDVIVLLIMKPAFRLLFTALLLLAASLAATEKTDFSGSYTLTKIKGGNFAVKKGTVWTIDVVQSATAIQVTKVKNGHRFVNTISLDGPEVVCEGLGGIAEEGMTKVGGKCKSHFKER